jgi:hypothetical protein
VAGSKLAYADSDVLTARVGHLTEPTPLERAVFAAWMRTNTAELQARFYAAQALSRSYDRAAYFTRLGGVVGVVRAELARTLIEDFDQAFN